MRMVIAVMRISVPLTSAVYWAVPDMSRRIPSSIVQLSHAWESSCWPSVE